MIVLTWVSSKRLTTQQRVETSISLPAMLRTRKQNGANLPAPKQIMIGKIYGAVSEFA